MNKAVHALVYVILAVAAVALYFEFGLYGKKELLKDRNRQLEDYLVTVSRTIEKVDASKPTTVPEVRKDVSPVEAKLVETPETENLLEDYPAQLEEANLDTFKWDTNERVQLRSLYKLGVDGEKIADAANPGDFVKKGPGTAAELLDQLVERAKAQQSKLNTTRTELANVRTKLEALANDHNKLKPELRQAKIDCEEQKKKVEETEAAKKAVEEQLAKTKQQVEDLNSEIASAKDELQSAKDETDAAREDLAKKEKLVDQLKKMLVDAVRQATAAAAGAASAITSLPVGDKGKLVHVDNKLMFAVVEFSDAAMQEMLGQECQGALPQIEMCLRRKGFKGPAGEFVGRIRLRSVVSGKNFVIADVLGNWAQAEAAKGDVVFAE